MNYKQKRFSEYPNYVTLFLSLCETMNIPENSKADELKNKILDIDNKYPES